MEQIKQSAGIPPEEEQMRRIGMIIIHCTATRRNQRYTIQQLYQDHRLRGFSGIGYHYYITREGDLIPCRPIQQVGAHCKGFNYHSIGIAYEGGLDEQGHPADTRTECQKQTMRNLVDQLRERFPGVRVIGHRDASTDVHKACPCFDVSTAL